MVCNLTGTGDFYAGYYPRSTYLYMLGFNSHALKKVRGLASDEININLEDAVAPNVKEPALEPITEITCVYWNF